MGFLFHARHVAVEEHQDFLLVGLADDRVDTYDYLILQRAHRFDAQDVRNGMNTYYVERSSKAWCCYGGVEQVVLHRDRLDVALDRRATTKLGGLSAFEVTFEVPAGGLDELRVGLARIFTGAGCFEDRSVEEERAHAREQAEAARRAAAAAKASQGKAKPKPGKASKGKAKPKPGKASQGKAKPKPGKVSRGKAGVAGKGKRGKATSNSKAGKTRGKASKAKAPSETAVAPVRRRRVADA